MLRLHSVRFGLMYNKANFGVVMLNLEKIYLLVQRPTTGDQCRNFNSLQRNPDII